ncbi:MAG: o-succinylbenzoate--CoA ligase [Candidatus Omnitrophica bacterium]|nr:o-succinylbenzoate--CoA ligase [Candidatus Omnitrophota bacterium]
MTDISCPIAVHARISPDAPAIVFVGHTLSYKQLDAAIGAAVKRMQDRGVSFGSRVGILARNDAAYVIALLALWRMGSLSVLLNPRLPSLSVEAELSEFGCDCLLTNIPAMGTSPGIAEQKIFLHEIVRFERTEALPESDPLFKEDQPAVIVFTSGSQGAAKAAVLSFGNLFFNALGANEHMSFGPGDRWLLSLPLFHVGGLGIVWRVFLGGGTMVIPADGGEWLPILGKEKISHLSLVPTQLFRLMRVPGCSAATLSLKAILLGGAPIPGALLEQAVSAGFPVYVTYGLTEMASQVATSKKLTAGRDLDRRARALPYRDMAITEAGEILVKGKTLFLGYADGVELRSAINTDGWFATGDLGEIDAEGGLKVKGRKDNMFLSGGENILPEEIEGYLLRYKGILQAVVAPVLDEEFGARPVALLTAEPGITISRAHLMAYLELYLPKFKIPSAFYYWPETVRTEALKVSRKELLTLFLQGKEVFRSVD